MSRINTNTFSPNEITKPFKKNELSSTKKETQPNQLVGDICRMYLERNVKSLEKNVDHCPDRISYSNNTNKYVVYISLNKSRQNNLQDLGNILLPRGKFQQKIKDCLPEPESLNETSFIVLPILVNFNFDPTPVKDISLPRPVSPLDLEISELPSNDPREVQHVSYKSHHERLLTFSSWGDGKPEAKYLSQAGFFYTGNGDKIRCFSCGIAFKDLTEDMQPIKEHVKHSDQCSYLRLLLGGSKLDEYKANLLHHDPEYYRKSKSRERKIRHPDYQSFEARIASFTRWPLKLNIRVVADNGLYYTGYEAVVRCFACDGGFRMLKSLDDLWLDHCFFFPSCPYMEAKLGTRFTKLVQETVLSFEAKEDSEEGTTTENIRSGKNLCKQNVDYENNIDDALKQLFANGNCRNIGPVLDELEAQPLKKANFLSKLKDKELEKLREENAKLRRMAICSSCERNADALMLPCLHLEYCMQCAEKFRSCPTCDLAIKEKQKIYW